MSSLLSSIKFYCIDIERKKVSSFFFFWKALFKKKLIEKKFRISTMSQFPAVRAETPFFHLDDPGLETKISKKIYENYRRRRNLGWEWKLSHGDLSGQWIQRTQVWILLGAGLLYFFFFPLNKKSGYAQNLDRSFANFLVGAMEAIRSASANSKPMFSCSWLRLVKFLVISNNQKNINS